MLEQRRTCAKRRVTFSVPSETRFKFVLARDLGMTVAELETNMTQFEFRHWKGLYNREAEESKPK